MATHSSTLAWRIPWTEEPGRLQSMGLLGVEHDWATSLSLFTFMHWRRKWQPTPVFLPGESQGQGAWWAAVSGVPQSQTRLKRLGSSSSSILYVQVGCTTEAKLHVIFIFVLLYIRFFSPSFFGVIIFSIFDFLYFENHMPRYNLGGVYHVRCSLNFLDLWLGVWH